MQNVAAERLNKEFFLGDQPSIKPPSTAGNLRKINYTSSPWNLQMLLHERLKIKALLRVVVVILEFRIFMHKTLFCLYRGSSFEVILGAHRVLEQEASQVLVKTTEKHVHPNWDSATLENDIALLKLPVKVELNGKGERLLLLLTFWCHSDLINLLYLLHARAIKLMEIEMD